MTIDKCLEGISPKEFQKKLYSWHDTISRPMPWKETVDPYKIWLSEIILQQTRVAQGTRYYNTFVAAYPSIDLLAAASEDDVLSLWKGLGYYTRARNLRKAAQEVVKRFGGIFPRTYQEILSLPGVGPYTASAICSFAYNLPHAVVDGNVFRVFGRVFGISKPIDSSEGKKHFHQKAQQYLDFREPGKYNQALMDFGALQCVPKVPNCSSCPLKNNCLAFSDKSVDLLPIKSKKIRVIKRTFNYFIIEENSHFLMEKRRQSDIWKGLYQPPLFESDNLDEDLANCPGTSFLDNLDLINVELIRVKRQRLTHQIIEGRFYRAKNINGDHEGIWKNIQEIQSMGLPKIVSDFFEEYCPCEHRN